MSLSRMAKESFNFKKELWPMKPAVLSAKEESKALMEPLTMLLVLSTLAVVIAIKNYLGPRLTLPPSPFRLPLLGNALMLKDMQAHKLFQNMSQKYGSIFSFWVGSKSLIIVNEIDLTKEALLKQDKIFAGRPQRHMGKLYSKGFKGVIIADYGETWKLTRKLAHHALKLYGSDGNRTEGITMTECNSLIQRLQICANGNEAVDIRNDLSLSVMNIICTICFGTRYELDDPEFLRLVQANTWFFQNIQNAAAIDAFPLLRYLPFKTLKMLHEFIRVRDEVLEKKFREHEMSFDENNNRDIVDHLISSSRDGAGTSGEVEDYLGRDNQMMLIGDLFIAGADTISTTLQWTLLYMAVWPKKQKKVQEELDRVIGKNTPSILHKPSLPYLQATINETLRMSSLTPLVLRKATQSTKLGGFDIPKGTTVMFNSYAMNHDERNWKNPEDFEPERFLDENGEFYQSRVGFMPFSAGKRVCLGESIAKMELSLILAYLLQNFEFQTDGDVDLEGVQGASLKPKPYKLRIVSRM